MPSNNINTNAIVLKKTKLSETDLIITFLNEDGTQLRAVAKGARKPASTLSARLELCSQVHLLLAKGKNLDIVREVKLINPYSKIRNSIEKFTFAAPALELIEKTTQQNLNDSRLYDLTISFLNELSSSNHNIYFMTLCLAHLIKTISILGYRPNFSTCCICNKDMREILNQFNMPYSFSLENGGVLCVSCSKNTSSERLSSSLIILMHKLLHNRFSEIKLINVSEKQVYECFRFVKKWLIYYLGIKLKSLDMFLSSLL